MGSFKFTWDHPASEVYVTGTFDNWAKTAKLEKKGEGFEKVVELPKSDEKIYYKFVVDGAWITDHTAPQENDGHDNLNNVLTPERITPTPSSGHTPVAAAAVMSSAHPTSSTAVLAGQVPLEPREGKREVASMPGNFPETPQNEVGGFSVNPLPATAGIGNPVQLKAGEKVPDSSEFTSNNITSAVTTDKESYEKGGASIGGQGGVGVLGIPPVSKNLIPESSLPMGGEAAEKDPGVHLSSAGAQSTTADLAGKVPLEPKTAAAEVPEVVKESQAEAHAPPEASGSPEAVEEKSAVEKELKSEVPTEPATSESGPSVGKDSTEPATSGSGLSTGKIAGLAAGGTAAVGGAAAATFFSAKDTATRAVGGSAAPAAEIPAVATKAEEHTAAGVPLVVEESLEKSHTSPEAAANEEAVLEKKAVENELLKEVKTEQSSGEPAPTASAATTATAPKPTADSTPVAAAAATAATAPSATPEKAAIDSRDISPMSKTPGQSSTQPIVTTGVGSASTPATSTATASTSKPAAESPVASPVDKKKNRLSLFDKIKTKISHKDKK